MDALQPQRNDAPARMEALAKLPVFWSLQGKRAIVAGPGNPPVVVDDSACLTNAARSIVKGAAYDNNLLCIGEKEVFAVETIFDKQPQSSTDVLPFE